MSTKSSGLAFFACGVPLLTTESTAHGPEIAYLEQGVNGLMTANDVGAYAAACVRLLRDPAALDALRAGCAASANEYTLQNMARRFAQGIGNCLQGRPQPIASNASQA